MNNTPTAPCKYYRRSIDALMSQAGQHSVPSAAEEAKLVRAAKRGDTSSTHRLVLGHLRLVLKVAHSLSRGNNDLFEELAASGIAGMISAIDSYKAQNNNGGRFMHYAMFYVKRHMRSSLNSFRTPVSANPNNYDIARKIFAYEEEMLRKENRRVTHIEIGKKFGLTPNRVERMKKLLESPMFLDHAVGSEDERSGHDICADKGATSPALLVEKNAEAELVAAMMKAHLTEREIAVLQRRFGFNADGQEDDLRIIGSDMDLSRERIRQIETQALKKLRFHLSQSCPTYRERAGQIAGDHPAVMPSLLKTKALPLVSSEKKPVAKISLAKAIAKPAVKVTAKRELELCVA